MDAPVCISKGHTNCFQLRVIRDFSATDITYIYQKDHFDHLVKYSLGGWRGAGQKQRNQLENLPRLIS